MRRGVKESIWEEGGPREDWMKALVVMRRMIAGSCEKKGPGEVDEELRMKWSEEVRRSQGGGGGDKWLVLRETTRESV